MWHESKHNDADSISKVNCHETIDSFENDKIHVNCEKRTNAKQQNILCSNYQLMNKVSRTFSVDILCLFS
uniref:Uncharacterized protein n=1 Tax=Arundo donax TaxID=35708 RepID=A0A0A9E4S6_ARUDO